MKLSSLLFTLFTFLVYPAAIGTFALYLYPLIFGCGFPAPSQTQNQCLVNQTVGIEEARLAQRAPFRLLALGDPQLEGDSSLPNPDEPMFPSWRGVRTLHDAGTFQEACNHLLSAVKGLLGQDIPRAFRTYRKRLDLLGNDYYLAHIYRIMHWWSDPTHVTVLGDLIGSQWVSDDEFDERGWRFWNRVFKHATKIDDEITASSQVQQLGQEPAWNRRLITPAGNHDIGYAGDITTHRLDRFERMYGRLNWDITFQLSQNDSSQDALSSLSSPPELRIVVLNSMNLDGPTSHEQSQAATYDYVNDLISRLRPMEDRQSAVIALTHIPLYKEEGICVDGPYLTHKDSGIREQNHLSTDASKVFLEGVFGMSPRSDAQAAGRGRSGLVINGHDHEGCDIWHSLQDGAGEDEGKADATWRAQRWHTADTARDPASSPAGVREITARSMMGMYGGYAYLVSAWFDASAGEWRFASSTCHVGVQHFWWAVHVVDLVTTVLLCTAAVACLLERVAGGKPRTPDGGSRDARTLSKTQKRASAKETHNAASKLRPS